VSDRTPWFAPDTSTSASWSNHPKKSKGSGNQLDRDPRDVHLEPFMTGDDGYRSFRFRYLLPLAVEVQYLP
jgi:hypothetical protein